MNPPGRFLKEDSSDGFYYDIGDAKAIKKVGQALREDASGIRNEIEHESSGDEAGDSPKRNSAVPSPTMPPAENGAYRAPVPAGFAHGPSDGNTYQNHPWMSGGMHRQHSAPMEHSGSNHFHHQHVGGHGAPTTPLYPHLSPSNGSSTNIYNVPVQFYNGVRSTGNKLGRFSQTATEAVRHAVHHPGTGLPAHQVAFGRVFTPTVMSSGSTMSTISGLSRLSGMDHAARASQRNSASGELRVSQLSEMTNSMMSLGSSLGLTRSNSLPELGISKEFTSLSDASFAVLMEEEERLPEQWGQMGLTMESELRGSSGTATSGSSGNRLPPIPGAEPARNRTTSAVSAMSWQSGGSQPSNVSSSARSTESWLNPIRSRLTGSIYSDHSLSSSRYVVHANDFLSLIGILMLSSVVLISILPLLRSSVLSDMSADLHALDLAPSKMM